jgi:1-deoxy-D-xylulose-5-phosphate reductoisomerase
MLARQALQSGGAAPTILNAANEVAVQAFLKGRIGFLDIARVVEATLERTPARSLGSLSDVHEADSAARRIANELMSVGVLSA